MRKLIFTAIALMVATVVSAQDVKTLLKQGSDAFAAKNYQLAANLLNKVIDTGSSDESAAADVSTAKEYLPRAYFMMGGAALKSGNFDEARKNFETAASNAEIFDNMAMMNKAKQWIGTSYELQGSKPFNAGNYAEALPIFEAGYASDPRNAKMANFLGICYCETGEYEKGFEILAKVVKMGSNPKYAEQAQDAGKKLEGYRYNYLADMQKSKNYNGVIELANNMLAADPKNAAAAKVRLQAYMDKGDYASVFGAADSAAALQTSADEKSNVYFILGAAYNAREMKPEAIAAFKKVTSGPSAAAAKEAIKQLSE